MPARPGCRRRIVDDELDAYPEAAPSVAIALEGARAIGKTSSAVERAIISYELDNEAHLAIVSADVDLALVITSGTDAYRRPDGIAVIPAALLGP